MVQQEESSRGSKAGLDQRYATDCLGARSDPQEVSSEMPDEQVKEK